MGNKFSRKDSATNKARNTVPSNNNNNNNNTAAQNFDEQAVNRLRRDLMERPETFLLNNVLMSVQFYENFDREMQEFRTNQTSDREIQLNRALAADQKHCLLPDTVLASVNQRVRFKPMHGPRKLAKSEPLLPQRMFIVHDNIEVLVEGETDDYSTVDGPVHRAVMEFAEKSGYIQLKQIEFLDVRGQNGTLHSDESDDSVRSVPSSSGSANRRMFERRRDDSACSTSTTKPAFFTDVAAGGGGGDTAGRCRSRSESRRSSLKEKIFRSKSMSFKANASKPAVARTSSAEHIDKSCKQEQQHQHQQQQQQQQEAEDEEEEEEADNDYKVLRRLTEPKPLDETRAHRNPSDTRSIPARCITELQVKQLYPDVDEEVSDDDDDAPEFLPTGKRRPPIKKKPRDLFTTKRYFNSVEFFKHFGDVFGHIYPTLGFTGEAFRSATSQSGAIQCDMVVVMPTIATTWPAQAYEWHMRARPVIIDPATRVVYQWPTRTMIQKIRKLQAQIVPFGFLAKRGTNRNHALEWSLCFPAAERYMSTCMSHTQVRCFFFLLALYKTFLMPTNNTRLGLAPHHIRTLVLWECERNYVTWPEDRLGSKLLRVLAVLYRHLAAGRLPDYFVRERNLLETCPSKDLRYSQERLHQIMERPVVHVIAALRNLRYTSGLFFPTLDFKALYRIMTVEDSLAIVNPALACMVQNNAAADDEDDEQLDEPNPFKENKLNFWHRERKREDEQREWNKRLRKQLEQQRKHEENLWKQRRRRVSVDSIDLQVTVPQLDSNRRRVLLDFFIAHFTALASRCMCYESYRYALLILNHCRLLAILLGEEPSGEMEARPWREKIAALIDKCMHEHHQHQQQQQQQQQLVRESRQFSSGMTYNVGASGHHVNMDNLQNSYNNNSSSSAAERKHDDEETNRPARRVVFENADTGSTDL